MVAGGGAEGSAGQAPGGQGGNKVARKHERAYIDIPFSSGR